MNAMRCETATWSRAASARRKEAEGSGLMLDQARASTGNVKQGAKTRRNPSVAGDRLVKSHSGRRSAPILGGSRRSAIGNRGDAIGIDCRLPTTTAALVCLKPLGRRRIRARLTLSPVAQQAAQGALRQNPAPRCFFEASVEARPALPAGRDVQEKPETPCALAG